MLFNEPIHAFALTLNDSVVLKDSASGGAFSAIATPVLLGGGVVFAARLFDDGTIKHVKIESISTLASCRGSVYAQSDAACVFLDCESCLREGKKVLFVGTPCQCAALKCFLRAQRCDPGNALLLCDLICHGVPSQELLKAYFTWLSNKKHTDDGVHGYKFRSKRRGWGLYYYYYYFRRGKRYEVVDSAENDPYYSAFTAGLTFRDSCYSCPFARLERVSDLTIGDFWGVESLLPQAANQLGVSLVLTNTSYGDYFLQHECADSCKLTTADPQEAARYNSNLRSPSALPEGRASLMPVVAEMREGSCLPDLFSEELRVRLTPKRFLKAVLPHSVLMLIRNTQR